MWKRDESVKPTSPQKSAGPETSQSVKGSGEKVIMDLGNSMVIKGELSASEDLTLSGQMEGSVKLPDHQLTIAPRADIRAEIAAKAIVIHGAVTGNVTAGERVEIQETGSVTGDIVAPRLVITDGGCLQGKVKMPQGRPGRTAADDRRQAHAQR